MATMTCVSWLKKDVIGGVSTTFLIAVGDGWKVRTVVHFWSGNHYSTTNYEGPDENLARNTYACVSR